MMAIIVEPKKPGTARREAIPEPDPRNGSVLVEAVAVGACGTDVDSVFRGMMKRNDHRLFMQTTPTTTPVSSKGNTP